MEVSITIKNIDFCYKGYYLYKAVDNKYNNCFVFFETRKRLFEVDEVIIIRLQSMKFNSFNPNEHGLCIDDVSLESRNMYGIDEYDILVMNSYSRYISSQNTYNDKISSIKTRTKFYDRNL